MFRRIYVTILCVFFLTACNFSNLGRVTSTPDPSDPKPKSASLTTPTQGEPVFRFSAAEVTPFPFSAETGAPPVYETQAGTPVSLLNFVNPEAGCNWSGVAGQVFGPDGLPVTGLVVEIGGTLEGSEVFSVTLTGGSLALGMGGYEIKLADHPVESKSELHMQLFDLNGNALSALVNFTTEASCDKNLVLVNFTDSSAVDHFYIPLISRNSNLESQP